MPVTLPLNTTALEAAPLHLTWLATAFTVGVGFTSTVAVVLGPGQPFAVGVIINVTVIGANVVLVNDPLMLPDPLAAIPITVAVLFLTQL